MEQRTGVDGVVAFVVEFARSLLRVDGIAHCLRFSVSFLIALIFLTQNSDILRICARREAIERPASRKHIFKRIYLHTRTRR